MVNPDGNGLLAQMTIFIAAGLLSGTRAFVCPNVTELSPCACGLSTGDRPAVDCIGPDISQEILNRVLTAIRSENNGVLDMYIFVLRSTNLTEVDLTQFEGGIFAGIVFDENPLLSRVVGPDLNSTDWNPIRSGILEWTFNNFQDEGLQTVFSYFSRPEITTLILRGNKLMGSLGQEFLPGFSKMSNLTTLRLEYNNILRLGGGQFRGLNKLAEIHIQFNGLSGISKDAFLMDGLPTTEDIPYLFNVYLGNNSLTDDSFHPSSGISKTNRKVSLLLDNNQFRRVKEDQFLDFLETDDLNSVSFWGNPIWCDPEMKWLKDRREELGGKVVVPFCVNDPGETLFTSSLVSNNYSGNGNSLRLSIEILFSINLSFLINIIIYKGY